MMDAWVLSAQKPTILSQGEGPLMMHALDGMGPRCPGTNKGVQEKGAK